jgi:putative glutamine amidotransferase
VETLGANLRATAESRDGLVEAVEDVRADRWIIGVQWHPEIDWEADQFSYALFGAFIHAAQNFSDSLNAGADQQELSASTRVR